MRNPFDTQNTALTTLSLSDRSLVSSGVYERYFEKDGKRYHHLLDPFTGYPVENGLLGVTILSSSSMEGDALSTTAFVLGPEEGMALIESLLIRKLFLLRRITSCITAAASAGSSLHRTPDFLFRNEINN